MPVDVSTHLLDFRPCCLAARSHDYKRIRSAFAGRRLQMFGLDRDAPRAETHTPCI